MLNSVPDAATPPRWRWLRRLAHASLVLVLLLWSAFFIAWLTLHWAILPHIDRWRPTLERHASEAIGQPLSIGAIHVHSGGWVPTLDLQDLRLYDPDGREALLLRQVRITLSPQSLLRLRFEQVLIDGARLELRRSVNGHLFVAGRDWDAGPDRKERHRGRDWLFEQPELVLRNASLRWIDEAAGTVPLELTQLDLVLRNGVRQHALRLDATPSPELGQRFSIRGRFTRPLLAESGDVGRWSGLLYGELPRLDLGVLGRHFKLPFELGDGEGALRAWVDVTHGVPSKSTLDLALRDVSLRLAPQLQRLDFVHVHGRLETARDTAGARLGTRDFGFSTADGLEWRAGVIDVTWQQLQDLGALQPSTQPVTGGTFSADRLDLQVMARTAERLPLGQPLRKLLRQLAPRGTVEGLKGGWSGALDAPDKYQVSARLSGLSWQAAQGPASTWPGLQNAQLQIDASESGGEAQLTIKPGALVFPGLWEEPELTLQALDTQFAWRVTPAPGQAPAIELQIKHARFANADLQGELAGTWRTGTDEGTARSGRLPGWLELNGKLQRGRAESVARYLPLGMAADARDYVRRSIRGGSIESASFRVKGDLGNFPFRSARDGELRITLQARDLRYDYLPSRPDWVSPWPALEQVSGEIEFDRLALRLRGLQGRLWGYELREVQGGIDDLTAASPVLTLDGQGRGPVAELLRFVRSTPVDQAKALEAVDVSGDSELKLALSIPFAQPAQSRVRGNLQLTDGELRLHADLPPLRALRANVDFTENSFVLRSAKARLLGGDTRFDGGLGADGVLRIGAQGVATADALRVTPQLASAASVLRGQAAWRASFALDQGRTDIDLSSTLVGLQIALPAPFNKPADAAWPLRVQIGPAAEASPAGKALDVLNLELGEVFKARYERELSGQSAKVLRGSLAVLDTLPDAVPGVSANLKLGKVDLGAWQAALEPLSVGNEAGATEGYLPQIVKLSAQSLSRDGRFLSNVVATAQQRVELDKPAWHATVRSEQLDGRLEYRAASPADPSAAVVARLSRLSVPQSEVAGVEDLLSKPTTHVPALDIVIDDFELRGRKLGRLQVEAVNRSPPGRTGPVEWQLDKLELDTPEARFKATGRWVATGTRRMAMDFSLELADSGAFVERLGGGTAMRGGKGKLLGKLSWAGSPLALDYPSLDGALEIDIDAGRFQYTDSGGARLLGVLSLRSLSRRLTLGFSDLFESGFAFDSVDGKVQVARGVADTRDLRMHGQQAMVLMQGSADLKRETQDLRVLVVPNFDASGAALATMAISPVIGLGALFAQWALREPLAAAAAREFHITGNWDDPKVQTVQRALGTPLPAADAPAAAPVAGAASAADITSPQGSSAP